MIHKQEKDYTIADTAVLAYGRLYGTKREKVEKYQDSRRKLGRMWQRKKVKLFL